MMGYSYIRRRKVKVVWAVYRNGKLVNGSENLTLRDAKARASAYALGTEDKWEVGSYSAEATFAPSTVDGCRQVRNRNEL